MFPLSLIHILGIYEVGKRVKNRFRFLEAHDMTIEAVVTKIMWLSLIHI